MRRALFSVALLSAFGCGQAFAEIDPIKPGPAKVPEAAPQFESLATPYDFEGIIALSNCSGSLIRFDDSRDTDKAVVLTNGHCTGRIAPGTAIADKSALRTVSILDAKAKKIGSAIAERLIYGTMSKTDIALYRLNTTYQEIADNYGIAALELARTKPEPGTPIEVLSGYWKRGYSCEIDSIAAKLQEGDWFYEDSVRYSQPGCEVIGGTSGSPVLAAGSKTVIAVNNTGNMDGLKCLENNPCEIKEDGTVFAEKGLSYAQETYLIYGCRTAAGAFDFNLSTCKLPKAH